MASDRRDREAHANHKQEGQAARGVRSGRDFGISCGGKAGASAQAERDIAAVTLGLQAPGMLLRGISHLVAPGPPR
jgi:hypothetical protein